MKWFVSPTPRPSPRSRTTALREQGRAVLGKGELAGGMLLSGRSNAFQSFVLVWGKRREMVISYVMSSTRLSASGRVFFKTHVFVMCCPDAAPLHIPAFTFSLCQTHWFPLRDWLIILRNSLLGVFCIYFCLEVSSSSAFRNTIKSFSVVRHFGTSCGHRVSAEHTQMEIKTIKYTWQAGI